MEDNRGSTDNPNPPRPRASSPTESVDPLARFAPVFARLHVPSLVSLAVNIRRKRSNTHQDYTCTVLQPPNCGSFNLLYTLEFNDGTKWILRIPVPGKGGQFDNHSVMRGLRSEAMTMRFLKLNTTISIPEVYDFCESPENEIGVPYIVMEFMTGFPVYDMWWDEKGPTLREQRREKILDSVAEAMAQLREFQFDKVGAPQYQDDSDTPKITGVGPLTIVDEFANFGALLDDDTGAIHFLKLEPYNTSREYFEGILDLETALHDDFQEGIYILLRMMARSLPRSLSSDDDENESFVLAHPEFDSQNVLVAEDGTVTALLDWDNVHAVPRSVGYQRYPAWIMRDWNPIMYGYGRKECRPENSPTELEGYRARYARTMKSLESRGSTEAIRDYGGKSHSYEAVWIAVTSQVCCDHIVEKIFQTVWEFDKQETLPEEGQVWFYDTAIALAQGTLEKEREKMILDGFKKFFAVPCDSR